jgi:hypothetical protein
MSQPGFAEVSGLKADHLPTVDPANTLQADEQLLNGIKIDIVAREARDVIGKPIGGGHLIDDLIAHGEVPNNPSGDSLTLSGHGFSFCAI